MNTNVRWVYEGTRLAISSTGKIYIPTYGGLFIYDTRTGQSTKWTGFGPEEIILDANDNLYVFYYIDKPEKIFGLRAYNSAGEKLWDIQDFVVMSMAIGEGGALYVVQRLGEDLNYTYNLCILGETESFICHAPYIITATVNCAKPEIVLQAPTPDGTGWRLHFKVQAYADEAGTLKLDEVDSTLNPERFKYSPDNGTTWRDFLADGLPPEQYGALIKVRVDVGPRRKVWLRASVGA